MNLLFLKVYSNPAELVKWAEADRSLWRKAWIASVVPSGVLLVLFVLFAVLQGSTGRLMLVYTLVPMAFVMPFISIALVTTQRTFIWLLYLVAPPSFVAALLAGIGPLWPCGLVLSGAVGVPLLVGVFISCACSIDVYNQRTYHARQQLRRRYAMPEGLSILPRYQNRARRIRLGVAIIAGAFALLVLLLFWATDPYDSAIVSLAFVFLAVACLRLDATLLSWMGRSLVSSHNQRDWQATYAGRWALFVPAAALRSLMLHEAPPAQAGAALIALLQDGCLAPVLRRGVARLTPTQAMGVALGLSLQFDGASAIRYLLPAFPAPAQPAARTFAQLAEEATRPPDMRRWLQALHEIAPVSDGSLYELTQTLMLVSEALQQHQHHGQVEASAQRLRRVLGDLYGGTAPESSAVGSWPGLLLERVSAHDRLLRQQRF